MKRIFLKTGLSLVELIIAVSLVSIVLLGVFAITNVLSNNNVDYGQRYLIRSETQNVLNHVLNNAFLAQGDATNAGANVGYESGTAWGDANTFCIHQAATGNVTGINLSTGVCPNNDCDIWLCYTWSPAASATAYQINYCTMPYNTGLANRGATSCVLAATISNLCVPNGYPANLCSGPTFLGSAFNITNSVNLGAGPYYDPINAPTTPFAITINNCLNNAAAAPATCAAIAPGAAGNSGDPVNNPEVQVSGSVFPPGEGTS